MLRIMKNVAFWMPWTGLALMLVAPWFYQPLNACAALFLDGFLLVAGTVARAMTRPL